MPWSPRPNHLRFAVEHDEDRAIVRLAGELDYASAVVAQLALERAGPDLPEITLDLSRVVFLDAAGVRFLISAQRRARATGRRMIIRRPSRTVRRMLELTGVRSLFTIDDSDDRRLDDPATPELTRILDTAIQFAMRITHADRATAQLLDPRTGALRIVAQCGFDSMTLDYFEIVSGGEPIHGDVAVSGQPVWVPDVTRSSVLADIPAVGVLLDAGVRAVASIPVRSSEGQLIAMLSVHHRLRTDWTAEQKAGLARLGESVAQQCLDARRHHGRHTEAASL